MSPCYNKWMLILFIGPKKIGPQLPRRYMGITMVPITKEICTALRERELYNVIPIGVDKGVMVWKVIIGSPAYRWRLISIHFPHSQNFD